METGKNIIFKINHDGDLRRWTSSVDDLTIPKILERTNALFSLPAQDTLLRYQDDEGDMITLMSDDDLAEAISVASMTDSSKLVLRLDVISPKPMRGMTPRFVVDADADSAAVARVKQLEVQMENLKTESQKAAKYAAKTAKQIAKEAKKAEKQINKSAAVAKEAFMASPAGAMLDQVVASLTPREGAPVTTPRDAINAFSKMVYELSGHAEPTKPAEEPTSPTSTAVHEGVTCDDCEMSPIVGVRYKKKGANYDLCEQDYAKLSPEHQPYFVRIESPNQPYRCRFMCRKVQVPKLNLGPKPQARFVEDVNIPENTEILPGTQFTKIWRLRNTGEQAWPQDSKLMVVGGDKFEGDTCVDVHPAGPGEEIDVAASMVAPSSPGRYVSYWRLAQPPSMRKFGQRIWVQVVIVNTDGTVEFESSEGENTETASHATETAASAVHIGVECDASGMHPIVGPRFNKKGADYDLCEESFLELPIEHQAYFQRIEHPGAAPIDIATEMGGETTPMASAESEELEARHGWSTAAIEAVQNSGLAALMEALKEEVSGRKFPADVFDALTGEMEPLFAVLPTAGLSASLEEMATVLSVTLAAHPDATAEQRQEMLLVVRSTVERILATTPPTVDMLSLLGNYVCGAYPAEERNDWHYVTIAPSPDADYLVWTNRAGAWWPLYPTEDSLRYRVGEESPYSEDGHDSMEVIYENGNIVSILGPSGEPYTPFGPFDALFPEEEATEAATEEEAPASPRRASDLLAEMGIAACDLSESMMAEVEHAISLPVESSEGDLYDQPHDLEAAEEIFTEAEVEMVDLPAVPVDASPWSISEALSSLGVGEADLSASMLAEIQSAVSINTEQAEKAAEEESRKMAEQVEAKAQAEANQAAKAALEEVVAAAAAEAEAAIVKLEMEAQAAAAEAEAEAVIAALEAESAAAAAAEAEIAAVAAAQAAAAAQEAAAEAEASIAALEAEAEAEAQVAMQEKILAEAKAIATQEAADARAFDEAHSDPTVAPLVANLTGMGFGEEQARNALAATNNNIEEAVNILIAAMENSNPDPAPAPAPAPEPEAEAASVWNEQWDDLLDELTEMGFEDQSVNRELLAETNGNVKDAVKELVTRERNNRDSASESGDPA